MSSQDKQQLFTRRALIIGGAQGLLLTSLVGRLYYLQVNSSDHYRTLSDKNRIHSRLIAPSRGQILDRSGKILATHHNAYRAIVIRDQATDLPQLLTSVQSILGLDNQDIDRISQELKRKPRFVPVTLKEGLSWDEVTRLELHLPDLTGMSVEQGQNRSYPFGPETCHCVGYVATVGEKDLDGDPLLELPGVRIGKAGIEKSYETELRGKPGVKQVELNSVRRIVRELSTSPSSAGRDINLTLDLELQQSVFQRLSMETGAAAVILDAKVGGVLSYVSSPGFDSNLFANGISKTQWDELLNHPQRPLNDKVLTGQYGPGSTFKMIVALAALEAGVITPSTPVCCTGSVTLGNHEFHCHSWKTGGHGTVTLENAIAQSCDVYFYHVGKLLGIDPMAAMAKRFGLGSPTGIDLPGEKPGLIPSREWKSLVMGKSWALGETYNASIGQGYVLATPLQLAVMTARLVTGKVVTPHLARLQDQPTFEDIKVNSEHLNLVISGMSKVVNEPFGSAYASRITEAGFQMGGKTGSTQVQRITKKDREQGLAGSANRPWHTREHALFVGYAPLENPRFVASVLVEHGGSGARAAAPVARDILLMAQKMVG
ncbi:MAG: penicillin-binding protein 2 [Alphaproteobacteria bacterium]|jgi:penicillin-binding protein 2|nr:penicillin-binding protein 2 [Alphaproteobacteria bacterium]